MKALGFMVGMVGCVACLVYWFTVAGEREGLLWIGAGLGFLSHARFSLQ